MRLQLTWFLSCLLLAGTHSVAAAEPDRRPNIVVVLADDLGYGDLACYGHPRIKSPRIDRFATEGLLFSNCYAAAANCSPSRTGLMTGRTPCRVGIHNWIPMFSPMHVGRDEVTVARLLQQNGSPTCHVGKWPLTGQFNLPSQPQPSDHGFDHWFATQNNALPTHHNPTNFVRNGSAVGTLKGYSAQIVADEAIHWLRQRDSERPFFLFVCFHEPHEPINSARRYQDLYEAAADSTLPNHHGNVTQMDAAFGQLLDTLDRLELRDNTLVLFTSDNGPAITRRHPHGSAGPLRDKKGFVSEGGIRVPGILRWPGQTTPGQISDEPISGVDLLPTLCQVADIPLPTGRALDGTSFLPALFGQSLVRSTPLYWQFNFAQGPAKVAMRMGDWKITATLSGPQLPPAGHILNEHQAAIKSAELEQFELYHLGRDIGEQQDLAGTEQQRLQEMSAQLRQLYQSVRDESPRWPAWQWPGHEGTIIRAYYDLQKAKAERRQGRGSK